MADVRRSRPDASRPLIGARSVWPSRCSEAPSKRRTEVVMLSSCKNRCKKPRREPADRSRCRGRSLAGSETRPSRERTEIRADPRCAGNPVIFPGEIQLRCGGAFFDDHWYYGVGRFQGVTEFLEMSLASSGGANVRHKRTNFRAAAEWTECATMRHFCSICRLGLNLCANRFFRHFDDFDHRFWAKKAVEKRRFQRL